MQQWSVPMPQLLVRAQLALSDGCPQPVPWLQTVVQIWAGVHRLSSISPSTSQRTAMAQRMGFRPCHLLLEPAGCCGLRWRQQWVYHQSAERPPLHRWLQRQQQAV